MAMRLGYFVGETASNLRRNVLLTLAAISTVAISMLLLGTVLVGSEVGNQMVTTWEQRVEISVFLQDEITPEQSRELKTTVEGMPEVQQVFFESKEAAYKEFQRMFQESPLLTENIEADALPASYRIKLHDPDRTRAVASRLEGQPGVEDIRFGGAAFDRLVQLTGVIRTILIVGIALTLSAAILLIANTIRLGIYARRKEIGIMKLVGATNWFIRVPFIFEGVAQAALGAFVATGAIFAGKLLGLDKLQQVMPFLPITVGNGAVLQIFLTLLVVGLVIGTLGSTLALRRFLEV